MSEIYNVHEETLTAIADKIRERKFIDAKMTPAEMVDEIDEMGYALDIDEKPDYYCAEPFERPAEYPNLELIDVSEMDGVYLTYDLRKTPGYAWIGLYGECEHNPIHIERGHLSGNEFVVDEQHTINTKQYFRQPLDEANGEVQLWRVWSDGQIISIRFVSNSGTNAQNYHNQLQPCVERRGRLPYCESIYSYSDSRYNYPSWSTHWMMRDDVRDMVSLTTMVSGYENAYELQEVHFDGWDTSNVTNMSRLFCQCQKLRHIPFDKLDTQRTTTLSNFCQYCYSLEEADISHFDIDKCTSLANLFDTCRNIKHIKMPANGGVGALTNMAYIFCQCNSLAEMPENCEKLDVSNVTNLSYAFHHCKRIKHIDLHDWKVKKATTIAQMFAYCVELRTIDLSGWDVSGVKGAQSCFEFCMSLCDINLDGWSLDSIENLSYFHSNCRCLKHSDLLARINWGTVTRVDNCYVYCNSLKTVEISGCNVPNRITAGNSLFNSCWSLEKIVMPGMNFTEPVAIDSMFAECHALSEIDVSGWHIADVQSISALFSNCYMLKEIDLSDWVIDDGVLKERNTVNSMFTAMRSCKSIKAPLPITVINGGMNYMFDNTPAEYIDVTGMDLSDATNVYVPNMAHGGLKEFYPPLLPPFNMKFDNDRLLSHDSIVRIFNALPVVTSTKTITIGQTNRLKVSDAEEEIATSKGWEIA